MWCVKGHSLTHRSGDNELQALSKSVIAGDYGVQRVILNTMVNDTRLPVPVVQLLMSSPLTRQGMGSNPAQIVKDFILIESGYCPLK